MHLLQIMKSCKTSAETLRAVLAHPLLQRDTIDGTMEALASANEDAQEISDAIQTGAAVAQGNNPAIDESELEAELAGLVADVEVERQQREREELERRLREKGLKVPLHVPSASEENWTDNEMDEEYRHVKEKRLAA